MEHVTSTATVIPRNDKPPTETDVEKVFVSTLNRPSTFAPSGPKKTVVPSAAAPQNLPLPVREPVLTVEKVIVSRLINPTALAFHGTKTAVTPTVAAPANFQLPVREPVLTVEKVFVSRLIIPTTSA